MLAALLGFAGVAPLMCHRVTRWLVILETRSGARHNPVRQCQVGSIKSHGFYRYRNAEKPSR